MMEIIMLGTGNAMVQNCYNTCFVLRNDNGECMLVDAGGGNGIFQQMSKAGVAFENIRSMFVTHSHTDHILGTIWVIRKIITMMQKGKYSSPFHIYGHDEVIHAIKTICSLTLTGKFMREIGTTVILHELSDGEHFQAIGMDVTAFDIHSTKTKQFGFKSVLPDNRTLVCLGDEPYNEVCASYVGNPDWLLCEAFCLYAHRDEFHPYEKHHSTALDAGKMAQQMGVRNLLLYHTEDKHLPVRKKEYTAEAKQHFPGNVFVPDDLECIEL